LTKIVSKVRNGILNSLGLYIAINSFGVNLWIFFLCCPASFHPRSPAPAPASAPRKPVLPCVGPTGLVAFRRRGCAPEPPVRDHCGANVRRLFGDPPSVFLTSPLVAFIIGGANDSNVSSFVLSSLMDCRSSSSESSAISAKLIVY
jgi:hypothetical protein